MKRPTSKRPSTMPMGSMLPNAPKSQAMDDRGSPVELTWLEPAPLLKLNESSRGFESAFQKPQQSRAMRSASFPAPLGGRADPPPTPGVANFRVRELCRAAHCVEDIGSPIETKLNLLEENGPECLGAASISALRGSFSDLSGALN